MCYVKLKKSWLDWSNGYDVPLERTTLRGIDKHAAIAGKAFDDPEIEEPVKQRDAIWHCFVSKRGKSGVPTFKSKQLDLAIVIETEDFNHAVDRRELLQINTKSGNDKPRKPRKPRKSSRSMIGPISESEPGSCLVSCLSYALWCLLNQVPPQNDDSLFEDLEFPVQNVLESASDLDAAGPSDKRVDRSRGTVSSALGFKRTRPTTVSHQSL
jgi:hypothetical protein